MKDIVLNSRILFNMVFFTLLYGKNKYPKYIIGNRYGIQYLL